jgi:hypothetical protein
MPVAPVTDWGQAIMTSASAALAMFLGVIPRAIGFIVIVIIGWLIASALAAAVAALLRSVRFNELATRSGFGSFVQNMGVRTDSAGFVALVAKWFVRLITLVVAFDALGLPAVSQVLEQLLLWLPNLVVALIVLVIAGLAANTVQSLVRGASAEAGLGNPSFLANVARMLVWAFGIVVAVNQLGIATTLVNTLFMATVGAVALALGLAFGLGGRETAALIVRDWYERGQQATPKLARAADAAQDRIATDRVQRSSERANAALDDGHRSDRPLSTTRSFRPTQND